MEGHQHCRHGQGQWEGCSCRPGAWVKLCASAGSPLPAEKRLFPQFRAPDKPCFSVGLSLPTRQRQLVPRARMGTDGGPGVCPGAHHEPVAALAGASSALVQLPDFVTALNSSCGSVYWGHRAADATCRKARAGQVAGSHGERRAEAG